MGVQRTIRIKGFVAMKAVPVVRYLCILTMTGLLSVSSALAAQTDAQSGGSVASSATDDASSTKDIDDLETQILGSRHSGDSVKDRLERLEKAVFGKVSSEPDQEERICRLQEHQLCKPAHSGSPARSSNATNANTLQYTPDDTGNDSVQNDMNPGDYYATEGTHKASSRGKMLNGSSTFIPQSDVGGSGSQGIISTLNRLETQILGKTQPHKPLTERVADLEAQVFPGKDFSSEFIDVRINRLRDVIGDSHASASSKSFGADASHYSDQNKTPKSHTLMHSIGHAFSEAGGAAMSLMGALGTSNLYMSGDPFGYDPYGMGGLYSPYGTSMLAPGGAYGALGPYGGALPYAGGFSPYYGAGAGLYGGLSPYGAYSGFGSPVYNVPPGTFVPNSFMPPVSGTVFRP